MRKSVTHVNDGKFPEGRVIVTTYDPDTILVPVYNSRIGQSITKEIPLRNFSPDFEEMYITRYISKVYMDEGQVTSISKRNTIWIPKIKNYYKSEYYGKRELQP